MPACSHAAGLRAATDVLADLRRHFPFDKDVELAARSEQARQWADNLDAQEPCGETCALGCDGHLAAGIVRMLRIESALFARDAAAYSFSERLSAVCFGGGYVHAGDEDVWRNNSLPEDGRLDIAPPGTRPQRQRRLPARYRS